MKKKQRAPVNHKVFDDGDLFGDFEESLREKRRPAPTPAVSINVEYAPLIQRYDEVSEFMRELEFEPGLIVGFCFRRPCPTTETKCLNRLTGLMSSYIHCEVCIYDSLHATMRSLMITRNTKYVVFVSHIITQEQMRNWDFVWVVLTEQQRRNVRVALLRILSVDEERRFSSCNIWCFPCFSSPCYFQCCEYSSRTCSEMTMVFIREVFDFDDLQGGCCGPPNFFAYTPDAVYRYIMGKVRSGELHIK